MKGWTLVKVDDGSAWCEYCNTRIRWEYHLRHADVTKQLVVGNECVKSFMDEGDAAAALKFFRQDWAQRRGYFYKPAHERTFIVGKNKWDKWWVAYAPSVQAHISRWTFSKTKYGTSEAARISVMQLVCLGRAKVEARCPWPVTTSWEEE
jgi:hypothetical protein